MCRRSLLTLCAAAACSLAFSNVFAIAPEFTGDLPTVIITDRVSEGSVAAPGLADFDAPNGAAVEAFRVSSAFLFRFDDALDLEPIIGLNDASQLSDVQVLFNEFDDVMDLDPNNTLTLSINGESALTDFPQKSDFSGPNAFDAGLLSFRNIDFSEGTGLGPFDPVGTITSQDLRVSPTQSRIVSLYIDTVDSNVAATSDSFKSFEVITTIDDAFARGDRTSEIVIVDPPPTVLYSTETDGFDAWQISNSDNRTLGINSNGPNNHASSFDLSSPNKNGLTIIPATTSKEALTPLPSGTTSPVVISSTSSQVGLWGVGLDTTAETIPVTAGNVYRMRINWNSANTATNSNGSVFIQLGSIYESGNVSSGYQDASTFAEGTSRSLPKISATDQDYDTFLQPRGSSNVGFSIFLVDNSTSTGNDVAINMVEVATYGDRSSLGNGTVLLNHGGDSFSTATNEPLVDDTNRADYTVTGSTPGVSIIANTGLNAAVPDSITPGASVITAQFGPVPNANLRYDESADVGYASTNSNGLNIETLDTGLELDPTKIYAMDVWVSTTTASAIKPQLLLRANVDYTSFSVAGFSIGPSGVPALTTAPDLLAETDAKMYSNIFRPNTPNAGARTSIAVQFLWVGPLPFDALGNSTIRVHRIILTEFD